MLADVNQELILLQGDDKLISEDIGQGFVKKLATTDFQLFCCKLSFHTKGKKNHRDQLLY